jgi:DNA (cytosine-5)-methyltransferase 3A
LLKDILEEGIATKNKSYCIDANYFKSSSLEHFLKKKLREQVFCPIRVGDVGSKAQAQRIYDVKGKSICLSANGGGGGAKTGLYKIDLPDGDYAIRKLTPIECERLQTLPDNYTEGVSNTQRYKMIGNGWTIDVIAHIFSYMKE